MQKLTSRCSRSLNPLLAKSKYYVLCAAFARFLQYLRRRHKVFITFTCPATGKPNGERPESERLELGTSWQVGTTM
eukprot:scaffold38166_cov205-Skeletonema_dohrnii-CCMP3373.AAC.1